LWKTFRGKPKGVRLRPEFVFGFTPERCSESARNAVRLQPGMVFGLPRNTQSKKRENLWAAYGCISAYYGFFRIHKMRRVTPAMEAQVTSTV